MTDYTLINKRNSLKDKRCSALLTALISLLIFLAIFYYRFTQITEKSEVITTMLVNFGDQQTGAQIEEPQNQEGSPAAETAIETPVAEPEPIAEETKPTPKDKIITGSNTKVSAPKAEPKKTEALKSTEKTTKPTTTPTKTAPKKAVSNAAKTGTGDGQGTAAIGNLLKGRGTKPGSQGNTPSTTGNTGDPLGGDGNGDSRIGVDRKLIGFIPGTMGRGGAQPAHSCTASGSITISYTVDKAGNVVSARRLSGISDPCAVRTTAGWVKQYVKAEKANTSSTGTYQITF